MEQTQNRDCKNLYARLQRLDFAIVELALYLDSYPDNAAALDYYQKLTAERETVAEAYKQNCGPMTIMDNKNPTLWEWGQSPWPWQNDM
ncbi:MAG: spore coat protein CotJB [Clostridia bacterium]|nr:spore coat protein CotJB [Clostridia bacterium]